MEIMNPEEIQPEMMEALEQKDLMLLTAIDENVRLVKTLRQKGVKIRKNYSGLFIAG